MAENKHNVLFLEKKTVNYMLTCDWCLDIVIHKLIEGKCKWDFLARDPIIVGWA